MHDQHFELQKSWQGSETTGKPAKANSIGRPAKSDLLASSPTWTQGMVRDHSPVKLYFEHLN